LPSSHQLMLACQKGNDATWQPFAPSVVLAWNLECPQLMPQYLVPELEPEAELPSPLLLFLQQWIIQILRY
jgi:hypothetical protein